MSSVAEWIGWFVLIGGGVALALALVGAALVFALEAFAKNLKLTAEFLEWYAAKVRRERAEKDRLRRDLDDPRRPL